MDLYNTLRNKIGKSFVKVSLKKGTVKNLEVRIMWKSIFSNTIVILCEVEPELSDGNGGADFVYEEEEVLYVDFNNRVLRRKGTSLEDVTDSEFINLLKETLSVDK